VCSCSRPHTRSKRDWSSDVCSPDLGAKGRNLDDFILYFRAGEDVYRRRGGWQYLKNAAHARWAIHKTGISGFGETVYAITGQAVVSLMPNGLRGKFYDRVLRR